MTYKIYIDYQHLKNPSLRGHYAITAMLSWLAGTVITPTRG